MKLKTIWSRVGRTGCPHLCSSSRVHPDWDQHVVTVVATFKPTTLYWFYSVKIHEIFNWVQYHTSAQKSSGSISVLLFWSIFFNAHHKKFNQFLLINCSFPCFVLTWSIFYWELVTVLMNLLHWNKFTLHKITASNILLSSISSYVGRYSISLPSGYWLYFYYIQLKL